MEVAYEKCPKIIRKTLVAVFARLGIFHDFLKIIRVAASVLFKI